MQNLLNATNDTALIVLTDATDLVAPAPKTPVAKLLSFTVVNGYLTGNHACKFELHATGCRDLKKMQRTGQASYEVLAETPEQALAISLEDSGGNAKASDYWTQPCCQLSRMKAAGRA